LIQIACDYGNGPLDCRVCLALCDGETPLGSAHDILKWIDVDKDGQHSDWNHWLKEKVSHLIADLQDHENPLIVEYHRFNGILTPMVNVAACRLMIRLCVNKSKVANAIADEAMKLWTNKMSNDERLPEAARAFLRGTTRSATTSNNLTEEQVAIVIRNEMQQFITTTTAAMSRNEEHVERLQATTMKSMESMASMASRQEQILSALQTIKLSFCSWIRQSLDGYFSTQLGFFDTLKSVIQGSKQRKKTSHNAALYPADQRATDFEMVSQLTLLKVAVEQMPTLTPRVYESVKNAYGKRAKCLRMFLLQEQHQTSEQKKPLLWTNTPNGGQQYVYLECEKDILIRAWSGTHFGRTTPRASSCAEMARNRLDELNAGGLPLGEWTSDTCTLLLPDLSSGRADE